MSVPRSPCTLAPLCPTSRHLRLLLLALLPACAAGPDGARQVRFDRDDVEGRVLVYDGAREIVGWQYGGELAIPHWFPLRSPSGRDLVAQHPDPYPHHRAVWIADKVQLEDGPVVDFYHCSSNRREPADPAPGYRHLIRQVAMPRCEVDGDRFVMTARLQWLVDGTEPVLDDAREMVVRPLGDGEALVDLSWTLRASHGAVTFHSDRVHYAWPYLRIHPRFSVQQGGAIVDDAGRRDQAETDGRYARWVDYSATVDGATEGVAVFPAPDGQRRRWLTRDYGTFGPRRPDAQSGTKFTLAKGESIAGAVRLFVHRGDAVTGGVQRRYEQYAEEAGR